MRGTWTPLTTDIRENGFYLQSLKLTVSYFLDDIGVNTSVYSDKNIKMAL